MAGPDNTFTIQVQAAEGKLLTALEHCPPGWGADPKRPAEEGVLVWDLADPVRPRQLAHWRTGGTGTHRNYYAGGRYAHLAAGMPGFNRNIYVILDLADPSQPREVGRWFLPEQYLAGGGKPAGVPALHGPAAIEGDRRVSALRRGGDGDPRRLGRRGAPPREPARLRRRPRELARRPHGGAAAEARARRREHRGDRRGLRRAAQLHGGRGHLEGDGAAGPVASSRCPSRRPGRPIRTSSGAAAASAPTTSITSSTSPTCWTATTWCT